MNEKDLEFFLKNCIVRINKKSRNQVFYFDLEKIYSEPEIFRSIINKLVNKIEENLVCPIDCTISPLVGAVAFVGKKRIVMVREIKNRRNERTKYRSKIIGSFKPGEKVHLIDDVFHTGKTTIRTIKILKRAGLKPVKITVILNLDFLKKYTEKIEKKDVKVYQLYDIGDILY